MLTFDSDLWGMVSMTNAMNKPVEGQHVPNVLDDLWFEESVDTIDVFLERRGDELNLVPATQYGGVGDVTELDKADGETFRLIYLPTRFSVMAHEVQGVRAFGTENERETVEMKRDQKLSKARRRLEATQRFHRCKALFEGKIYDANGSKILIDLDKRFDITRQSKVIDLTNSATEIKPLVEEAKDMAIDALGDSSSVISWLGFGGRNWFNKFTNHPSTTKAFDRWSDGSFFRDSQGTAPFEFLDVKWRKFYGQLKTKGGAPINFIDPDAAYLVPITDDPEAYTTWFGPAPYMDTVNTMGRPFYATPLDSNAKGLSGEACTVCLSLPRRPRSIIKLPMA
jgi:hypothetical protein